jgi:glycosyltransferase involved in cell wall biosynthesis
MGTFEYHKNIHRLVEAFAQVRHEHRIPHKLVLVGRGGPGLSLVQEIVAECDIEKVVVFAGYVPDDDLPGLYAGADVFAFPSLHEGFGIPVLEAMASGTPVLTSHHFALPEIAGDAALYVNPDDVEDIARGLWRLLSDRALARQLTERGLTRIEQFTLEQMVCHTLQFYHEIVEGSYT